MTDESTGPHRAEDDPAPDSHDERSEERAEAPPLSEPSTGVAWGSILLLLGIALVVVFVIQNTETVPVQFLWLEGQFSLAIVILVTAGAAMLLTELFGVVYRRRRRRRLADREELKKFRSDS